MSPVIQIIEADLASPEHAADIVAMVDAYASDPMGNDERLPADVLERLVPAMRAHPTTLVLLAYAEDENGNRSPVGIANCFVGFSTFAALPLINIHDLAVMPQARGQGIGRRLLAAVEAKARERGCCKVTLEVLENNRPAKTLYEAVGFEQAVYTGAAGGALFYAKKLIADG